MSLYTEIKFIERIGQHLRNFKQKQDTLWNFSCPICGDSQSNPLKARGYLYEQYGEFIFKCHNCAECMSLGKLIEHIDPAEYRSYCFERYADGKGKRKAHKTPPKLEFKRPNAHKVKASITLPRITELDESHPARLYLEKRLIPQQKLSKIFWAENWKEWVLSSVPNADEKYASLKVEESRIVIPCFDREGKMIGVQGRALTSEQKLRYMTIKVEQDAPHLVYGLEDWNKRERTYITEGPFDSLFLPNAIAAIGSDLAVVTKSLVNIGLDVSNTVLVFDNEPRNKEIMRVMERAIEENLCVCIWPATVREKDINEMILAERTKEQVVDIINANSFSGMEAKLRFTSWIKI